jgi:hypothetical protein
MNRMLQCKPTILPLFIAGVLACFGFLPKAEAVVTAPDGGYPNFNTAEGQNALMNLTTGAANTAVGFSSLFTGRTASLNTGVGAGTLFFNTGDQNTATGAGALLNNTTGNDNTASGVLALQRALRPGERHVAQRVSQGAPQSRATAQRFRGGSRATAEAN